MSEHVPAWKRIGLKVKELVENDPLAVATHLEDASVTSKKAKKQQLKRARAAESSGEKKPPKRQKLPKSERPPPPEKDQLVYLRQYTEDRENWKFSKQKQNWILKHVKIIEDKYDEFLVNYFAGLEGGSKDRMVGILRDVVDAWNKLQEEAPKADETAEAQQEVETATETPEKTTKKEKPAKKDDTEDLTSVDADFAIRAKKLLGVMIEEEFILKGIDDVAETTEQKEEATPESQDNSGSISEAPEENQHTSEEETPTAEPVVEETEVTPEPEKNTSKKDKKKDKKEKKKRVYNNLSIEQVEATEWVSPEDHIDVPPEENPEAEEMTKEGSDEATQKKEKKSKKSKKEKKSSKNSAE